MKILFAHPRDVAAADQAAAGLTGVTVRLRSLVPSGRMYVVREAAVEEIRYGFELDQLAEQMLYVPGVARRDDGSPA